MAHLGDFDLSTVVYGKFTTYRPSTGATFTLGGTPALSVYKDNSVTQSTTGVTLTADFDSVTGLNHFAIDTSADGTFYSSGSFFDIVITTGTVDSVSVVGSVVGSFTLRKTSDLKPTTAGRTLDVSAGGEAGVDWANVGSPTTAVNLSATNIDVDQVVASVSGAVGSVTGAVGSVTGNVGGNVTGSVGTVNALAANVITAASIAADAITDAKVAADVTIASVTGTVGSVTGAVGSVTGAVGSVTGNVGGNVNGSVGSVTAGVTVTTNNDKTGYALTAAEEVAIADALLGRNVSGGSSAGRTVKQALHVLRNKTDITAGTLTVYDTDDVTSSFTAAVTTTAGDPISQIDPA